MFGCKGGRTCKRTQGLFSPVGKAARASEAGLLEHCDTVAVGDSDVGCAGWGTWGRWYGGGMDGWRMEGFKDVDIRLRKGGYTVGILLVWLWRYFGGIVEECKRI